MKLSRFDRRKLNLGFTWAKRKRAVATLAEEERRLHRELIENGNLRHWTEAEKRARWPNGYDMRPVREAMLLRFGGPQEAGRKEGQNR